MVFNIFLLNKMHHANLFFFYSFILLFFYSFILLSIKVIVKRCRCFDKVNNKSVHKSDNLHRFSKSL